MRPAAPRTSGGSRRAWPRSRAVLLSGVVCLAAFALLGVALSARPGQALRAAEPGRGLQQAAAAAAAAIAGTGTPPPPPRPLAVLVPTWREAGQAAVLRLYLSAHLTARGVPHMIHVLEQTADSPQPFNPGALLNLGFLASQQAQHAPAEQVAFLRASLLPHPNTSLALPEGVAFLHLASEQSEFGYRLPYDSYCGGAWVMRSALFRSLGGLSTAYRGFEGLEDDVCRRVVAGGGAVRHPAAGEGRFSTAESGGAIQEGAIHAREHNQRLFQQRWGAGGGTSDSSDGNGGGGAAADGLATLPAAWQSLMHLREEGPSHRWWEVRLPAGGAAGGGGSGGQQQQQQRREQPKGACAAKDAGTTHLDDSDSEDDLALEVKCSSPQPPTSAAARVSSSDEEGPAAAYDPSFASGILCSMELSQAVPRRNTYSRTMMNGGVPLSSICACSLDNFRNPGMDIGFRTGGAQDVSNFREAVAARLLPAPTDITYEGVVKDYFFNMSPEGEDVEAAERCTDLFFPTYSLALAPDPLLNATGPPSDIFLSVGLDSGLIDFRRPRLNLLILLDISGSMDSGFGRDSNGGSLLEVAKAAIAGMMDRLGEGDALGICLFESSASTLAPMGGTDAARLAGLRAAVGGLGTRGGTNLQAGLDLAALEIKRFAGYRNSDVAATETRMVILTDAEPNRGDSTSGGLAARIKANALDGIHTTVVGVGLDFNTELVEEIGKAKGANYLSVHSPAETHKRLVDDFDCLVSPLVFDLALKLDSASLDAGWRILHAYGSPNPQDSALSEDGTVMKIHTLFPSPKTEEGVKGGVLLLRMKAPPAGAGAPAPLALTVTYRDRNMAPFSSRKAAPLPGWVQAGVAAAAGVPAAPVYKSTGVRKAVALARYVDALQSWLVDEHAPAAEEPRADLPMHYLIAFGAEGEAPQQFWLGVRQRLMPPAPKALGAAKPQRRGYGRVSAPLTVTPRAREALGALMTYMEAEIAAVGDSDMTQEMDLLRMILAPAPAPAEGGSGRQG